MEQNFEELKIMVGRLDSLNMAQHLYLFKGVLTEDQVYELFILMWEKYTKISQKYITVDKHTIFKIFNSRNILSLKAFHDLIMFRIDRDVLIPILENLKLNSKEQINLFKFLGECIPAFIVRNYNFINNNLKITKEIMKKRRLFHRINILDAGAGSGLAATQLGRGVYRVLSIFNIFKFYLKYANIYALDLNMEIKSDVINCVKADIRNIPFKNNFFDIVYASNLMYYISYSQLRDVLSEILRVLRKDGIFLFNDDKRSMEQYEQVLHTIESKCLIEFDGERFKIIKI